MDFPPISDLRNFLLDSGLWAPDSGPGPPEIGLGWETVQDDPMEDVWGLVLNGFGAGEEDKDRWKTLTCFALFGLPGTPGGQTPDTSGDPQTPPGTSGEEGGG